MLINLEDINKLEIKGKKKPKKCIKSPKISN